MSRHLTRWEDGGYVGVECDGVDTDMTLSAEDDEPRTCPRCGARLRLRWDVRIEEVRGPVSAAPETYSTGVRCP